MPEKETGGTGLETIFQKSKTKTTTTTKAHKISKFELIHHVLVTDYFLLNDAQTWVQTTTKGTSTSGAMESGGLPKTNFLLDNWPTSNL